MKNILLTILILITGSNADFSAEERSTDLEPKIRPEISPTKKITSKAIKEPRKKPRKRPMIHHHYYTNTIVQNCDRYIAIIEEKNKEIDALLNEIKNLKEKKYEIMRQQLKEEYDKEMKKFEERRKSY
ncbi:MAG TPA: hypothetical protein VLL31_08640 [Sulfurovum sp.]|nr:hypothetical protein [Sulfurovum sp.]